MASIARIAPPRSRAPDAHRNRRAIDEGTAPRPGFATITFTVSTVTVTMTSNVPVVWKGIPLTFTVATRTVTAITRVSPTVATLTLSASGAGLAYALGPNDPAIRTPSGGFAAAAAGTFP